MFSHEYTARLIESIEAKPTIWDAKSKYFSNLEYLSLQWNLVVSEMQIEMKSKEITANDVIYTWNNLNDVYQSCYTTGNTDVFKYFGRMRNFIDPINPWYEEPQVFYAKSSKTGIILKAQLWINILFTALILYCACFKLKGRLLTVPFDLPIRLAGFSAMVVQLGVLLPIMYASKKNTQFYSTKSFSLKWLVLIVPLVSWLLEKIFLAGLPVEKSETSSSLVLLTLGFVVIANGFAVNYGNWVERPFPPPRRRTFFRFVFSAVWIHILCVSNGVMHADIRFYIIPLCLAFNTLMAVYFIHYQWSNKDTLFPLLNEAPYEVVAETKYRLNFKQCEKMWQNDFI